MESSIFYFKKLSKLNIITLLIYIAFSVIFYYYSLDLFPKEQQDGIIGYALITQMSLYLFGYHALRNMTYFCCWLFIGLIHLLLYEQIKDDKALFMHNHSVATCLRNTVLLLILFQLFRVISLAVQHKELVVPEKGGTPDPYDNRKANFLDKIFFFTYMGAMLFLMFN